MTRIRANALTVDVEEWQNATILQHTGIISRPGAAVERNTLRLLEVLEEHGAKATWFFLGEVAEAFPGLVRAVAQAGHELGVHGFHHQAVHALGRAGFSQAIRRAKAAVEDASGVSVRGHRAVDFSVDASSWYALDALLDAGYEYDASVFPIRMPRYGVSGASTEAHWLQAPSGRRILEVPVSVARLGRLRVPFAGGGYFRLWPLAATSLLFRLARRQGPVVFYLHPCEIESRSRLDEFPSSLSPSQVELVRRQFRRHAMGRVHGERKLRTLLSRFVFRSIADVFLGAEP